MASRQPQRESVRKLTMKTVMGGKPDIELILKAPNKRMDLCSIYGIVRKSKPDASDYGSFVRFYGQFRATNLETGESFEAAQAIFPGIVQDQLFGAMQGSGDDKAQEIRFAVKLGVKYDKTAATQYVYTCESLLPVQENDPMQLLESSLMEQKMLPAPKKSSEK